MPMNWSEMNKEKTSESLGPGSLGQKIRVLIVLPSLECLGEMIFFVGGQQKRQVVGST